MYYYGARYYDPKTSIWLSVDPLTEQFPNWNPYNYTMQNPINLTDPTGMAPEGGGDPKKPHNGDYFEITTGEYLGPNSDNEVRFISKENYDKGNINNKTYQTQGSTRKGSTITKKAIAKMVMYYSNFTDS